MLLPPYVPELILWAASRFPTVMEQLIFVLLYALVMSIWIRALVMLGAYGDFRLAYTLRRRGDAPSDGQRFFGSALEFVFLWGRFLLAMLAIVTVLWTPFAAFRVHAGPDAPRWLARGVDGWDREVLVRLGAPALHRAEPEPVAAPIPDVTNAPAAPAKGPRHRRPA